MRLLSDRSAPCHEADMQRQLAELLEGRKYSQANPDFPHNSRKRLLSITPKIYREISIPNINRRSDVVMYLTDRRIINIECKMIDYGHVVTQALDHAKWVDYSYICFYADTYIPSRIIRKILDNGLGLILWRDNNFFEVIQATWQKGTDKFIRAEVLKKLKFFDQQNTAYRERKGQNEIDF